MLNENLELILSKLNDQQGDIVKSDDNILVTACPGSGKTRVLTHKLAYTALSFPNSRKKIIAITYTNRAAEEIKERLELLDIEQTSIWAGTIHQFCLEHIVRPYAMLAPRLSKGFKIVDEYVREAYLKQIISDTNTQIQSFDIPKIKTALVVEGETHKIIETEYLEVAKKYHEFLRDNKEIDFDLILSLSLVILNRFSYVASAVANIIRCIYVDEYQDTNELQYQIIGCLSNANEQMKLMFVGDTDQAIYGGLGGVAKNKNEIDNIMNREFSTATLNGCYRSTQRVVDYYSYFQENCYKIDSLSPIAEKESEISLDTSIHKDSLAKTIAKIVKSKIAEGVPQEEICVIGPQWQLIYSLSKELRQLLPDVSFDAPNITPIKADDMNVFYKLSKLMFTETGKNVNRRKRIASEITNSLSQDFSILLPDHVDSLWILQKINGIHPNTADGVEYFKQVVWGLFSPLGINDTDYPALYEVYDNFLSKVLDRIKRYDLPDDVDSFVKAFKEKTGVVVTSFHQVKGEEYDTVIAFSILKGRLPHWDAVLDQSNPNRAEDESKKMLYVISSRAKKSLYLFSEQGNFTSGGHPYLLTTVLAEYDYNYDYADTKVLMPLA